MSTTALPSREAQPARGIEHIVQALNGLAFGTVEITVHHGRIVQIERREKLRIPESSGRGSNSTDLG
ncbi:MAG TPA: YezD family protein [Fontimonas sp.]